MGARLPFIIEIVFPMLVLPIAFAYLFCIGGVAALYARSALRRLIFRISQIHRRGVARDR